MQEALLEVGIVAASPAGRDVELLSYELDDVAADLARLEDRYDLTRRQLLSRLEKVNPSAAKELSRALSTPFASSNIKSVAGFTRRLGSQLR